MLVLRYMELELTRTLCMECSDYQVSNIPFLPTSNFCKKRELSFTFFYCSVSGRLVHLEHDDAFSTQIQGLCGFYRDSRQSIGVAVVNLNSNTHWFIYWVTSGTGDFTSCICSLRISYRIQVIVL